MPAAHVASASPRQDVPEPGQPTALLQSAPPRRKQRATLQSREQSRAGLLHPGASRPPRAVVQPIPTLARPHRHRSRPPRAPRLQSTTPSQSTVPADSVFALSALFAGIHTIDYSRGIRTIRAVFASTREVFARYSYGHIRTCSRLGRQPVATLFATIFATIHGPETSGEREVASVNICERVIEDTTTSP